MEDKIGQNAVIISISVFIYRFIPRYLDKDSLSIIRWPDRTRLYMQLFMDTMLLSFAAWGIALISEELQLIKKFLYFVYCVSGLVLAAFALLYHEKAYIPISLSVGLNILWVVGLFVILTVMYACTVQMGAYFVFLFNNAVEKNKDMTFLGFIWGLLKALGRKLKLHFTIFMKMEKKE